MNAEQGGPVAAEPKVRFGRLGVQELKRASGLQAPD
jgi:hypothetical protein